MIPKASGLPAGVKRQLLDTLRQQLGSYRYDQIVDAVGEDMVLETVLQSVASKSYTPGTSNAAGHSELSDSLNSLAFIGTIIFIVIAIVAGAIMGYRSDGWSEAIGNIFCIGFFGICWSGTIYWFIRNLHYAVGIGLLLLLGSGALYLLWKAITYTGSGTISWFQWLCGHF